MPDGVTRAPADLKHLGAEPLRPDDPLQVGPYAIRALLGSGSMGRVYLGETFSGYAAIKQVLPHLADDARFLRRFDRELDNLARLPAGVGARLLAADRDAQPPWFATEYVPGVTLREAVEGSPDCLSAATCWVLLRELAGCLRALAELGMVHRDLKPSNVMLTEYGVRLIDFGVARAIDQSSVTAAGVVVGTPAYMPPEQATGMKTLTPAADVFSVGAMVAYAATGEPPFGTGDADLFYRILHTEPRLARLAALDPVLADLVGFCLAKKADERPTATQLMSLASARARPGPPAWPEIVASRIALRSAFDGTAPRAELAIESGTVIAMVPADALGAVASQRRRPWRKTFVVLSVIAAACAGLAELAFASGSASPPVPSPHQVLTAPIPGSSSGSEPSREPRRRVTASPSHSAAPRPAASPSASRSRTISPTPRATYTTSRPPTVVVSTSYSMIENVARHVCVANNANIVASPGVCDGRSGEGWQVANQGARGFELADSSGNCLADHNDGFVGVNPCGGYGTTAGLFWRIGTTGAEGGTLVNTTTGNCLAWASTPNATITTMACDSSDTAQLWYDAGSAQ